METGLITRTHIAMNNFETVLSIQGNFVSLDKSEIWDKLSNWLNLYMIKPKSKTTIHFRLDYINSRNVIELTSFLKGLFKIAYSSELVIVWEYEDEKDPLFSLRQDIKWMGELQNVNTLLTNPGYQVQLKNYA